MLQRQRSSSRQSSQGVGAAAQGGGLQSQAAYGNAALQERMAELSCEDAPEADLGAVRAGAPASKREALERHERNRDRMERFIDSALSIEVDPSQGFGSRPNLLRNSAEWIEEGNATLIVLTPTHDSHLRPSVPADKLAYFDLRTDYETDGATYDDTLDAAGQATNDAGLAIKFANVRGSMSTDGNTLTIIDPVSTTESKLAAFFTHEVQHDADQHRGGENWEQDRPAPDPAALTDAPQWATNSYQSEFRAYWMMNPEGSPPDWFGSSTDNGVTNYNIRVVTPGPDSTEGTADDVTTTVSTAFSNKRQEDIFNHMHGGGRADGVYYRGGAWTKSYAYLPYYYAQDPTFKAMVDAYTQPASGNLINSVRIQALSDAVAGGNLLAIWTAADDLDDLDRVYLQDRTQSQPFWDQASDALGFFALTVLENIVDVPVVGPHQAESVTVVSGDTLSALADRYLGDMARWPEIYRLNRDAIGPNPSRISVGLELRLPKL